MVNNDLIEFGKRLKSLRTQNNLSQEALGLLAGLDRTYISGIERGVRNVGLANIYRLARAMNLAVADLFCDVVEQQS
jgi:transcriptional regulator with XRE-family HTH domain